LTFCGVNPVTIAVNVADVGTLIQNPHTSAFVSSYNLGSEDDTIALFYTYESTNNRWLLTSSNAHDKVFTNKNTDITATNTYDLLYYDADTIWRNHNLGLHYDNVSITRAGTAPVTENIFLMDEDLFALNITGLPASHRGLGWVPAIAGSSDTIYGIGAGTGYNALGTYFENTFIGKRAGTIISNPLLNPQSRRCTVMGSKAGFAGQNYDGSVAIGQDARITGNRQFVTQRGANSLLSRPSSGSGVLRYWATTGHIAIGSCCASLKENIVAIDDAFVNNFYNLSIKQGNYLNESTDKIHSFIVSNDIEVLTGADILSNTPSEARAKASRYTVTYDTDSQYDGNGDPIDGTEYMTDMCNGIDDTALIPVLLRMCQLQKIDLDAKQVQIDDLLTRVTALEVFHP
jgi:hypothetical protein